MGFESMMLVLGCEVLPKNVCCNGVHFKERTWFIGCAQNNTIK